MDSQRDIGEGHLKLIWLLPAYWHCSAADLRAQGAGHGAGARGASPRVPAPSLPLEWSETGDRNQSRERAATSWEQEK